MHTRTKYNQKMQAAPGRHYAYKIYGHDGAPKGEEIHRANAKSLLGPFNCRTVEESTELSEEFAQQEIRQIAFSYNSHRLAAAGAPRASVPKQRMMEIEQAADRLHGLLATMGDVERAFFEAAGLMQDVPRKLFLRANAHCLPHSSVEPRSNEHSRWLDQLDALGALTRVLIEVYAENFGPDVGGRTNVHTDHFNSPEYHLILGGWYLFDRFKPGSATSTETGPFHIFLQQIYEYATGEGANETGAPALLPKIKQMLGPLREVEATKEELRVAEALNSQIMRQFLSDASLDEIEASIKAFREQLANVNIASVSDLKTATTRKRARK